MDMNNGQFIQREYTYWIEWLTTKFNFIHQHSNIMIVIVVVIICDMRTLCVGILLFIIARTWVMFRIRRVNECMLDSNFLV